jgi:glycosyltransferase involved in cell wall biosynthesis
MANPDVLLVHPQFDNIGGAERVSLKVIKILTDYYNLNVHILSFSKIDFDSISRQSNFQLNKNKISYEQILLPEIFKSKFFRFRIAILHRKAKKLNSNFKYLVSTYNELDFKGFAFQYIHHPILAEENLLIKYNLAYQKTFKSELLTKLYKSISDNIAYRNFTNIKKNYSVSNSIFISNIVRDIYNKKTAVVYPSLPLYKPRNNLTKKKQVLTISRFSRNKNVHVLLSIFDRLNEKLPDVNFVIAGYLEDESYFQFLESECKKRDYKIELKPNLVSHEIEVLYKESKYYINPKKYEHFGIAVLESMYHECLPIVHKSGGSLELVPFTQLQFEHQENVVEIIENIENNQPLYAQLSTKLKANLEKFSEEVFEIQIKKHLESYFKLKKMNGQ